MSVTDSHSVGYTAIVSWVVFEGRSGARLTDYLSSPVYDNESVGLATHKGSQYLTQSHHVVGHTRHRHTISLVLQGLELDYKVQTCKLLSGSGSVLCPFSWTLFFQI